MSPAVPAIRRSCTRFHSELLRCDRAQCGTVVAAFRRAALVRMFPEDRLLTLLPHGRWLVPWGVVLPLGHPLPGRGTEVRLARHILTVKPPPASPLPLDGVGATLEIPRAPASRALLYEHLRALPRRLGDDGLLEDAISQHVQGALGDLVGALLAPLSQDGDLDDPVRALVGVGQGSTPAGDDMLAGAAAATARLTGAGLMTIRAHEVLCSALRAIPPAATTEVSREMLRHLAQDHAPEPLLDLVTALGHADGGEIPGLAENLIRVGDRSGGHMLEGVRCLVEAVLEG